MSENETETGAPAVKRGRKPRVQPPSEAIAETPVAPAAPEPPPAPVAVAEPREAQGGGNN